MPSHYRGRDLDEYEEEDYDEYEEDGSEEEQEEEDEEEAEPPSQEQQEFLKMREQLKEKFRQKLKNETTGGLGHRSQSQDKRRTTNDNFGSFFGPSQPVIASRVLDERRSIQETQHIMSKMTNASSGNAKDPTHRSSEKKTILHKQKPKVVNEVKKKVQTLKDMRDYSFLLSDDADLPDAKEERPARNVSASNSAQAPAKSRPQMAKPQIAKPQMAKPARPVTNGHGPKNPAAKNLQSQNRAGPVKVAVLNKPRPATSDPRKIVSAGNGSGRSLGHKPLPSKVPAQTTCASKPPAKVMKDPYLKNKLSSAAVPHSSTQRNHYSDQRRPSQSMYSDQRRPSLCMYSDQRRPSQSLNNIKSVPSKPLHSSNSQPSKKIPPRDSHEDRLKRKPMKRGFDESDDEDAIGMIRKMFGYNPGKYRAVDDDVSDMEADFSEIQEEEERSEMIARKEDEEQLRLIEEEEERERMRKKKQKLKQR